MSSEPAWIDPTSAPETTQAAEEIQAAGAMNWAMVIPLALAQFLASYANSALNVSISDIARDLGTTVTGVQTAITVFTLVMAALMITGSKLTDIWGRKRTFLLGLILFGVGAALAGLAPAMSRMYLGYSLLMGIASALLIPPIYILTTVAIDDIRTRAAAFGIIGAAGGVGAAAGPLIGGIITSGISWRATFGSEVLLAVVIIFLSRRIVDVPFTGEKPKLDVFGAVLSAAGMALVVFGLLLAGDYGWLRARKDFAIGDTVLISQGGISPVWLFVGAGLLVLLWFVSHIRSRERTGKEPLVHQHVLKNRVANLGLVTQNVQWFMLLGTSFVVSVYLQVASERSAIQTGLIMMPATIGILLASWRVGTMVKKYSLRQILWVGFITAIVAIGLMLVGGNISSSDWALAPGLFLFGIGMGAILPASVNLVQSSMPEEDQSEISGVSRSVSNLGSSLGTAVAGAVLVSALISGVTTLTQESQTLPPQYKEQIAVALQGDVSAVSNTQVEAALAGQPQEVVDEVVRINAEARNRALGLSLLTLGLVGLLGLLASLRLPEGPARPDLRPVPPTAPA
jgi:MFS family permease